MVWIFLWQSKFMLRINTQGNIIRRFGFWKMLCPYQWTWWRAFVQCFRSLPLDIWEHSVPPLYNAASRCNLGSRKEVHLTTKSVSALILDFLVSRTVRNKCLCFIYYPVLSILLHITDGTMTAIVLGWIVSPQNSQVKALTLRIQKVTLETGPLKK